jgi:hypothetical protein
MCGLCGILGIVHWTEMSAHQEAFAGRGGSTVRAERNSRTKFVNAVLNPRRIKVSDFQATGYVVSSPTGRREIVDDIQSVWTVVERFSGAPIDPLDQNYLQALSKVHR